MQKWQVKIPDCKPVRNTGNPLSLEKLISLFMIICGGIVLALMVMIFELSSHSSMSNDEQLHARIEDNEKIDKIIVEIQNGLQNKKMPRSILLSQLGELSRRMENYPSK